MTLHVRKVVYFLCVMLLPLTAAHAEYTLHMTAWDFKLANGGGGFSGWLIPPAGPSVPGPGTQPNIDPHRFFCVDDNDYVLPSPPVHEYFPTHVTTLDLATWNLNKGGIAKGTYGIAGKDSTHGWKIDNNTPGMDALFRYRMAAYLSTLYKTPLTTSNTAYNNLIQAAIWAATDVVSGNGVKNQYYTLARNYVLAHPTDGIWKTLALVSPWAVGVGVGPPQQVFAARVPEPALLGILALGLAAAYGLRRRRIS